jgi:hypothetical protein
MTEITDLQTAFAALQESLSTENPDVALEFMESIAYQGFDPKAILQRIMDLSKGQDSKKTSSDILSMIRIACLRGTNLDCGSLEQGMLKPGTITEQGAMFLTRLAKFYHIRKKKQDRNTITLGRIVATFSPMVHEMMKDPAFRAKTTYSQVKVKWTAEELPEEYRFPGSNSLYPNNESQQVAYMDWAMGFHLLIRDKRKELNMEQAMKDVEEFAKITRDSPVPVLMGLSVD